MSDKIIQAKSFPAPKKCQGDCQNIVIKELSGSDEIAAAVEIDKRAGEPGFKVDNFAAMMKLERQMRIQQSIVAIDGKLNRPDKPLSIEGFGSTTKLWIGRCFDDLNGIDEEDVKKSLAGAKTVDLGQLTSGAAASAEPDEG